MSAVIDGVRDSGTLTWRSLLHLRRTPGSVFAGVLQPIMFVLLLGYVFGGSLGGDAYREYIMGGIFVQTVTFNASFTAVGLANDLQRGVVDRFRALPISRSAVLVGRTTSDLATSVISLLVTSVCGLLIGWRIRGSLVDALLGYLLILLFAFAMAWVGAFVGLVARNVEVAQSLGLIWLFPATFISTAFVSVSRMPEPLAVVAEWNPVSALANVAREQFGNPTPAALPQPEGWPAENAMFYSAICSIVLIGLFMTIAISRYRRIGRR